MSKRISETKEEYSERKRAYYAAYHIAHRDKKNSYSKNWAEEHREHLRKYRSEYAEKNRDRIRLAIKMCKERMAKEHPLYSVWRSMRKRVGAISGANEKAVKYYIAKGITICEEWNSSFQAFEKWACEHGWCKGLQIDRIDNNGNYEPSNCRFVTPKENSSNRRCTFKIEWNGVIMALTKVHEEVGCKIKYSTVFKRINRGWTPESAMELDCCKRMGQLNGKVQ